MATEPITGTVTQTNDNGFKMDGGDAWINYSKGGDNFAGYSGPKFQKGQQVEVQVTESKGRWYAQSGVVTVATRPGGAVPVAAAGPLVSPAPSYQATHDAAQERVASPDGGVAAAEEVAQRSEGTWPEQEQHQPGTFPFRDLSIMRQNRLNVTVTALVANLENCLPEEKAGRMITPWSIAEFERMLVEGAVYDQEGPPEASYQPQG